MSRRGSKLLPGQDSQMAVLDDILLGALNITRDVMEGRILFARILRGRIYIVGRSSLMPNPSSSTIRIQYMGFQCGLIWVTFLPPADFRAELLGVSTRRLNTDCPWRVSCFFFLPRDLHLSIPHLVQIQ